jgi:hypothetical protein
MSHLPGRVERIPGRGRRSAANLLSKMRREAAAMKWDSRPRFHDSNAGLFWTPIEPGVVRRSNLPAMCLISRHTTDRGGSGPFTPL